MTIDPTRAEPSSGSSEKSDGRRLRVLRISSDLFADMFKAGEHPAYEVIENALPADVQIRNCRFGWPDSFGFADTIELLLESKEFEPLSNGDAVPLHTPIVMTSPPESKPPSEV